MPNDPIVLPDRESWLDFRRSHIGGSDVSAICGINQYRSPYTAWAEKTGLLDQSVKDPLDVDGPAYWGKRLEAIVADEYAARLGRQLIDPGPFTVRVHDSMPFVSVTPDREVLAPDRQGPGIYEGKTTTVFLAGAWDSDEGPPVVPQMQVQHALAVTGWGWGSIACLIGGQRLKLVDVERDPELIELIEDRCRWFWDLVERRVPPPIDASDSTDLTIKRLHPDDDGSTVSLDGTHLALVQNWQEEKRQIKAAKEREQGYENALRAAIGGATFGELPDGQRLSLKTTEVAEYQKTVTAYKFRQLRLQAPAKKGRKGKEKADGTIG